MSSESELVKKRFIELARRSYSSNIFTFTDFLGLSEQSDFEEIRRELVGIKYEKFGGAEGAERVMIRFGDPEEIGYEVPFPICAVKISPTSYKFAERLGHRDYLGALLNLGIERSVLGDIVIFDTETFVFVKDDIAEYIVRELTRVRRTEVTASVSEPPAESLYRTEERTIQLSGERLDAAIAKVFNLSREDAQLLIRKGVVFVSGKVTESQAYVPKRGEVISVRGHGRFVYGEVISLSKKGKLNVSVSVYL